MESHISCSGTVLRYHFGHTEAGLNCEIDALPEALVFKR